jgi:chemotaxis protein CheC
MSILDILGSKEIQHLKGIFEQYIAAKTSIALSKMLDESINHNVKILDNGISNIKNIKIAPDEIKMCAVRLNGKGDTHIEILYTIKVKHARKIAAKLLCAGDTYEIDEMGTSAIQEVANIMTGAFFNALSSGTGFRVDLSTPNYINDEFHLLVNNSARDVANPIDYAVIADVELAGAITGIKLHMIIMQNPDNARKLLANHSGNQNQQNDNTYRIGLANPELDSLLDTKIN